MITCIRYSRTIPHESPGTLRVMICMHAMLELARVGELKVLEYVSLLKKECGSIGTCSWSAECYGTSAI